MPDIQTPLMLYVRLRLALATLARQIEVIDYVDPPLAGPLSASLCALEALVDRLGLALDPPRGEGDGG